MVTTPTLVPIRRPSWGLWRASSLAGAALAVVSCGHPTSQDASRPTQSAPRAITAESRNLWNSYVEGVDFAGLQPECYPRRYAAQGPFRGLVVLFHGYSACPQQFWDIAPLLAAQGFEVYLPLLPGHGRKRITGQSPGEVREDLSQLPNRAHWRRYLDFGNQLSGLTKGVPGTHTVGGLSVGGALATEVALSPETRGAWQRSLILAPMYVPYSDGRQVIVNALQIIPFAKLFTTGWGERCLEDSTTPPAASGNNAYGRGGFCSFQLTHLDAVEGLGRKAIETVRALQHNVAKPPLRHRLQLVNVDFDLKTRGPNLVKMGERFAQGAEISRRVGAGTFQYTSCSFAQGVPHSFISRYDEPAFAGSTYPEKVWLSSFLRDAVAFVARGTPFPTGKPTGVLAGYGSCVVDGEAPVVKWNSPAERTPDAARKAALYR